MPRGKLPVYPYNEEVVREILQRISEGETLISICKEEGMPTPGTFNRWAMDAEDFKDKYNNLHEKLARARLLQRQTWAEMAAEAAMGTQIGTKTVTRTGYRGTETEVIEADSVDRSRLKVQTLQWFLGRLDKKYAPPAQVITPAIGEENEAGVFKIKIINDPEKE